MGKTFIVGGEKIESESDVGIRLPSDDPGDLRDYMGRPQSYYDRKGKFDSGIRAFDPWWTLVKLVVMCTALILGTLCLAIVAISV